MTVLDIYVTPVEYFCRLHVNGSPLVYKTLDNINNLITFVGNVTVDSVKFYCRFEPNLQSEVMDTIGSVTFGVPKPLVEMMEAIVLFYGLESAEVCNTFREFAGSYRNCVVLDYYSETLFSLCIFNKELDQVLALSKNEIFSTLKSIDVPDVINNLTKQERLDLHELFSRSEILSSVTLYVRKQEVDTTTLPLEEVKELEVEMEETGDLDLLDSLFSDYEESKSTISDTEDSDTLEKEPLESVETVGKIEHKQKVVEKKASKSVKELKVNAPKISYKIDTKKIINLGILGFITSSTIFSLKLNADISALESSIKGKIVLKSYNQYLMEDTEYSSEVNKIKSLCEGVEVVGIKIGALGKEVVFLSPDKITADQSLKNLGASFILDTFTFSEVRVNNQALIEYRAYLKRR